MSQVIAAKVQDVARRDGQGLTGGIPGFIEAHTDPADPATGTAPLAVIGAPVALPLTPTRLAGRRWVERRGELPGV